VPEFGSVADYEWVMRATLVASTVHVPEALASWRLHQHQATPMTAQTCPGTRNVPANGATRSAVRPELASRPPGAPQTGELEYILQKEHIYHRLRRCTSPLERGLAAVRCLAVNPSIVMETVRQTLRGERPRLSQQESLDFVRGLIRKHGLEKNLQVIERGTKRTTANSDDATS